MEYTIQIPKEAGHIVPLSLVAHGIAKGFATRWGELSFHQPTYENALRQATINLIHAAQEGDLTAYDMHGRVIRLVTDEMVITSVTHRDLRFPLNFVCQRVDFMRPVFPGVAH